MKCVWFWFHNLYFGAQMCLSAWKLRYESIETFFVGLFQDSKKTRRGKQTSCINSRSTALSGLYFIQSWLSSHDHRRFVGSFSELLAPGPPAPRCGDSDQGIYVGEWMVPRCYGNKYLKKGLLITKSVFGVFEFFEKTSWLSGLPGSYFLYVGAPRWVTS